MQTSSQTEVSSWQRRNADDCAWAKYEESCVVYHRPSGMTHLLNGASVALLADILLEPRTLDEVVEIFLPEGPDTDRAKFRVEFSAILTRLESFGLLERVVS